MKHYYDKPYCGYFVVPQNKKNYIFSAVEKTEFEIVVVEKFVEWTNLVIASNTYFEKLVKPLREERVGTT